MDLNDTPEQAAFRQEVQAWLQQHADEAPPRSGLYENGAYIDARRTWQRKLAEAGQAGVSGPKEHGGQGRGPIAQVTVNQELSQAEVPGIHSVKHELTEVLRLQDSRGLQYYAGWTGRPSRRTSPSPRAQPGPRRGGHSTSPPAR